MQLAFKFDNWTCPLCGQDTKPDWWSEDGYSCMDCGPVLEEEYEEPPLINFWTILRQWGYIPGRELAPDPWSILASPTSYGLIECEITRYSHLVDGPGIRWLELNSLKYAWQKCQLIPGPLDGSGEVHSRCYWLQLHCVSKPTWDQLCWKWRNFRGYLICHKTTDQFIFSTWARAQARKQVGGWAPSSQAWQSLKNMYYGILWELRKQKK